MLVVGIHRGIVFGGVMYAYLWTSRVKERNKVPPRLNEISMKSWPDESIAFFVHTTTSTPFALVRALSPIYLKLRLGQGQRQADAVVVAVDRGVQPARHDGRGSGGEGRESRVEEWLGGLAA